VEVAVTCSQMRFTSVLLRKVLYCDVSRKGSTLVVGRIMCTSLKVIPQLIVKESELKVVCSRSAKSFVARIIIH
jgi:hypothetical protein